MSAGRGHRTSAVVLVALASLGAADWSWAAGLGRWLRRFGRRRWRLTVLLLMDVAAILLLVVYALRGPAVPPAWQLPEYAVLFFERAVNLGSGVSPVVPVLFLSLGFVCWALCQLKRLSQIDWFYLKNPLATPLQARQNILVTRVANEATMNSAMEQAISQLRDTQTTPISSGCPFWVLFQEPKKTFLKVCAIRQFRRSPNLFGPCVRRYSFRRLTACQNLWS